MIIKIVYHTRPVPFAGYDRLPMQKLIFPFIALLTLSGVQAQQVPSLKRTPPKDWQYLDPQTDSVAGISLYKAYELLKGRTAKPVIVGVIDSGVDLEHEDLKEVLWTNTREIAGNGKDDDKNGYIDDVHGWNFMASPDGKTYVSDQEEVTQIYVMWKDKFDAIDPAKLKNKVERRQYEVYQIAKKRYLERSKVVRQKRLAMADSARFIETMTRQLAQISDKSFTRESLNLIQPAETDSVGRAVKGVLSEVFAPQFGSFSQMEKLLTARYGVLKSIILKDIDATYNADLKPRELVGDNPLNPDERGYGSPFFVAKDGLGGHGTHVAGIIGAQRGNNIGVDGVADNVQLMYLAAVPNGGDERDKDVANAIRYAVDNGAKVINMSFGKRLSPYKEQIDAAIKYAEDHDVLLVHAAGNNGENYDTIPAYPRPVYENGKEARNFITVGNSTWKASSNLPANSSNYGQRTVDLFAPGTTILSTVPGNQYEKFSGTSMASPCVAGVAALIRSYFPKLTAVQVKELLMQTAWKPELMVQRPGAASKTTVPFSTLSRSGGIVNAYEAVKKAMAVN